MTEPTNLPLTQPIAEAITVVLDPAITAKPWRVARRRLTTALRTTLGRQATGWRVRRVPYTEEIVYDLLPPDKPQLKVDEAWDLTYALEALPDVRDAEPSFATIQDAYMPAPDPAQQPAPAPAFAAARGVDPCADDAAPAAVNPNEVDWSPRLVDAPCAWRVEPMTTGKARGAGVRVGHPDSGYRRHTELLAEPGGGPTRVLTELEYDFVDRNRSAVNKDGQHGLSTGSVIMSSDHTGRIVGIAPEAELVPLRVTKPRFGFIPAPILFDSGARALRDAIRYATFQTKCHVISISLGWFWNRSLHSAIREAEAGNVIVCAAAGNYTHLVAWPAAYREVIAVGGCNAARKPWDGSAHGRLVNVSGPAEKVWVPSTAEGGAELPPHQSSGTSFAVATLAGVAALWLAHHGRKALLERYEGIYTLTDVFRYVLDRSSDEFAEPVGDRYGVGIVNARRALTTPLPSVTEMRAAAPAAPRAAAAPAPSSPVAAIATLFPDISEDQLRPWLAQTLNVQADELDARVAGFEEEIIFQIMTNPALRDQLVAAAPSPRGAAAAPQAAPAQDTALPTEQLSKRLRSRLE